MAKKTGQDAYKTLIRVLVVLVVLTLLGGAGYVLVDQSIKAQNEENLAAAAQQNQTLEQEYRQAKAEEAQKQQKGEEIQWPQPVGTGWEVIDLSNYPMTNAATVTASRKELLLGGMLLLNHWHALPSDFPEDELLAVYTVDKNIPVSGSRVRLFPSAISALSDMIAAAKEAGLEGFLVEEGYRSMERQTELYDKEAERYSDKFSGESLIRKVRQTVNYPGTSEYQSGFSFCMGRYSKDDAALMNKKFHETALSDWMLENCWQYGLIFRFPVQGYPNATVADKSYKTGESKKLSIYRYVGKPHAAAMRALDMCMEEYIEYLVKHPHIAVYENGVLRYEITRTAGGDTAADVSVSVSRAAKDYTLSTDNMGGVITSMTY